KYIRLLAPAGAGKTASLLYRCVRLLEQDRSRHLLTVTFQMLACRTKIFMAEQLQKISQGL
ncbi:MAG: hypothetical protein LBM75_11570, partial [Myxococcales bacterium]|nr:hypothetical protein [Myxococcales bacterium]